jgi:hypothetical protein
MQPSDNVTVSGVGVAAIPTMSWSAIIGGWLVATGIASMMYVAGLALGFAAFDPYNAEATAKGLGMGTAVWMVLAWAASLFLGGMFASWFDGRSDQTIGTLHGVTVWGLSVTASGLLLAVGLTQVIHGGAAVVAGSAATGPSAEAMCIIFVSMLAALVAAGVGGWMGAGHIHRVHHLRRYEGKAARAP